IIWPDGLPMVFPSVDYLVVSRDKLAQRLQLGQKRSHSLLSWRDALALLEPYMRVYSNRAFVLDYDMPPGSLVTAIRELGTLSGRLQGAAMSAVLDSDIVDKVLKQH